MSESSYLRTPEQFNPPDYRTNLDAYAPIERSEAYATVEVLTSAVFREQETSYVRKQINEDEILQEVKGLETKVADLHQQYQEMPGGTERAAVLDRSNEVSKRLREHPAYTRYHNLTLKLEQLQKGYTPIDKQEGVLGFLESAGSEKQEAILQPGQHDVDKEAVIRQLKALPFENGDNFKGYINDDAKLLAKATDDDPFIIANEEIVGAVGFESWAGRDHGRGGKGTHSSSGDAIIDYATRKTELPPLDHVFCYIQPDGKKFFVSQNAHRAAAYKAQGAAVVPAKYVEVRLLDTNIIE